MKRRHPILSRHWLRYAIPAAAALVLAGGGAFAALETDSVESYWEGLWWALSLMTTVGFVGETPQTGGGRLVSSFLMLLGFVLLAMTTAAAASLFVREDEEPEEELERVFEQQVLHELRELRARFDQMEQGLRR